MSVFFAKDGSLKLYPQYIAIFVLGVMDWFHLFLYSESFWQVFSFYLIDKVSGIFAVLLVGLLNTACFAPLVFLMIISKGFEKVKIDEHDD